MPIEAADGLTFDFGETNLGQRFNIQSYCYIFRAWHWDIGLLQFKYLSNARRKFWSYSIYGKFYTRQGDWSFKKYWRGYISKHRWNWYSTVSTAIDVFIDSQKLGDFWKDSNVTKIHGNICIYRLILDLVTLSWRKSVTYFVAYRTR